MTVHCQMERGGCSVRDRSDDDADHGTLPHEALKWNDAAVKPQRQ